MNYHNLIFTQNASQSHGQNKGVCSPTAQTIEPKLMILQRDMITHRDSCFRLSLITRSRIF